MVLKHFFTNYSFGNCALLLLLSHVSCQITIKNLGQNLACKCSEEDFAVDNGIVYIIVVVSEKITSHRLAYTEV